MKVGFISLGCAKNLVDSEYLIGLFDDPYFEFEANEHNCDVIVINTCGFIESAKQETIDTILEMAELKNDKLKYLIVTGCFSQRYYEECLKEFPEVDLFVKITDYPNIHKLLSDLFKHEIKYCFGDNRKLISNNYCAYLRIGDGCDNRCAYCAIPLIRGDYRSEPFESVIAEAKRLKELGVKELNVIAQDTTTYGKDINSSLAKLLLELDKLNFKWIRVLYMYPDEITDELVDVIANSKSIVPYFDIPIQYGNDEILKIMNRRGNVDLIKNKINLIRKKIKNAVIRTTIIVGFPYETDKTFNDTLNLIKEIRFDSLGAFTYSKEEDTRAFDMPQIDDELKNQRLDILMNTQKSIINDINRNRIGNTYEVLIERYEPLFERYVGRTYLSAPDGVDGVVYIKSNTKLKNGEFENVRIVDYNEYDLTGEVID